MNVEKIETALPKLLKALDSAAENLTIDRSSSVTVHDVECALVEVLNLDQTADLLDAELDSTRIGSLLSTYDFQRLHPESLCTVELEESIIPPGVPILLTEVKIKQRGEIWFVYKNDADPFPSNPHAHNYDRGLKMHLGNGDLYSGRRRTPCGNVGRRRLLELRNRVNQVNAKILLPPLTIRF